MIPKKSDFDIGFDQKLADEVSEIRRNTVPIEITRDMLRHALGEVEKMGAEVQGLRLDNKRLSLELVALHKIIEERDAELTRLQTEAATKEQLAQTDHLTGLYLRPFFEKLANQDLAQARRRVFLRDADDGKLRVMGAVSVLLFDIDHFKKVNDTHGHLVGDTVLQGVAAFLKKAFRDFDVVCRWGGEEIAVYLPLCPVRMATGRVLEVCQGLAAKAFTGKNGTPFHITLTVGVSHMVSPEDTLKDLLERADRALYAGKEGGRNRVVVWSSGDPETLIPILTREELDRTPVP